MSNDNGHISLIEEADAEGPFCLFDKDGHLIIPDVLPIDLAAKMWNELTHVSNSMTSGKFRLIMRIYELHGEQGITDATGGDGYSNRILSYARNTVEVRAAYPGHVFTLGQLSVLALYSGEPVKQARIAQESFENNLSPVEMRAFAENKDAYIIVCENSVLTLERCLKAIEKSEPHKIQAGRITREYLSPGKEYALLDLDRALRVIAKSAALREKALALIDEHLPDDA